MGFFDDLNRFAQDLTKSLKPEEVVKLKSCKNCSFYQQGYCTQTTPPTKILSEYYAQGCIFYSTTGTITTVKKIDEIRTIRDVTVAPKSYIVNPVFSQDFTGWHITTTSGNAPTIASALYYKYVKFLQPTKCWLSQVFLIPLEVDAMIEFYCLVRSPYVGDVIRIDYVYTDQSSTLDPQSIISANTWDSNNRNLPFRRL